MPKKTKKSNQEKYQCWISQQDGILSFSPVDGYEVKEFSSHKEFQDYYYRKTSMGYKVQ